MKVREEGEKQDNKFAKTLKILLEYASQPWRSALTCSPSVLQSPSSGLFSPPGERWLHSSVWSWHLHSEGDRSHYVFITSINWQNVLVCTIVWVLFQSRSGFSYDRVSEVDAAVFLQTDRQLQSFVMKLFWLKHQCKNGKFIENDGV